tara:strand:- start:5041 stop:5232 length:192 start_codon:yes stop_codon:yes gene_type:complete
MAKKTKTSTMEEALARAVENFEDNTGEVVTEEVPAMAARVKKLLARKKTLQRQRKNFLPKSLK